MWRSKETFNRIFKTFFKTAKLEKADKALLLIFIKTFKAINKTLNIALKAMIFFLGLQLVWPSAEFLSASATSSLCTFALWYVQIKFVSTNQIISVPHKIT